MRVAVLSLTRDRLAYTQHCFTRLRELAGHPFDHFVLDNGSQDGTPDWLKGEYRPYDFVVKAENVGISRAMNELLDRATGYDVIVKFDNDCEPVTDGVLKDCAWLVHEHPEWLVSPRIEGLDSPMPITAVTVVDEYRVGLPPIIGGIFLAANADVYDNYRHDEGNPIWGLDDVSLCHHVQRKGGQVGYLLDHVANHYRTTAGQRADQAAYFARKDREYAGG